MSHFVHMRHQFLLSPSHSAHAQARTVLLTSVPDEIANEHDMRQFASFVPGGVDKVWIYRDTKELNHWFEERQHACGKLEGAVSSLLKDATRVWRKKEKMWKKQHKKSKKAQKKKAKGHVEEAGEKHTSANVDIENQQDEDEMVIPPPSREFLDELVPSNKRPKHRVGLLGIFGGKVDTIDWYKVSVSTHILCLV
jgi:calcium permeable stress-gated cation channel